MVAKLKIVELPIPTFYGDEIYRVDGCGMQPTLYVLLSRHACRNTVFSYDRKYDCAPVTAPRSKLGSTVRNRCFKKIPAGARVLDLGCSAEETHALLRQQKSSYVSIVFQADLNGSLDHVPVEDHDFVLLLDVIEHLASPEAFLDRLRAKLSLNREAELVITTANVAFIITRLMLLCGYFNYSKKGILDIDPLALLPARR